MNCVISYINEEACLRVGRGAGGGGMNDFGIEQI